MGIKALVPPILVDLRNEIRSPTYPTWSAAKDAAGTYNAPILNQFRAARGRKEPDGSFLAKTLLGAVLRPGLSIIDFGGAVGEVGRDVLRLFPDTLYTVVENETLVRLLQQNEGVRFATEMPGACDIWFSSGTLQYVDSPYQILENAFKIARSAVVLTRNSFSNVPIYRVQRSRLFDNGSGPISASTKNCLVSYPHQTLSEPLILELATKHGFRVAARISETDGVLPYRGRVYGAQLAFSRLT